MGCKEQWLRQAEALTASPALPSHSPGPAQVIIHHRGMFSRGLIKLASEMTLKAQQVLNGDSIHPFPSCTTHAALGNPELPPSELVKSSSFSRSQYKLSQEVLFL